MEGPYCDTSFVQSAETSYVVWQPLTPETIEWARQENKLLFLHIGFGACNCTFFGLVCQRRLLQLVRIT